MSLYFKKAAALHPIGRIGTPQDIIEAILFLTDDTKSGWITGQILRLDGGRCLTTSSFSKSTLKQNKKAKL